jgi:hypothetical protein
MKLLQLPLVTALCGLLVITPMTGCSVSQAKINTVVQDIATYGPIISTNAQTLASLATSLDPTDAALIATSVATLQKDSAFLTTLSNQYLANPSPSLLNQIAALVSEIATTDSAALIQVAQIKNPQSVQTAQEVLAGVATTVTILSAYLSSVNVTVTPAATTAIKSMKPMVQKATLVSELNKAKTQGIIPENTTLQSLGF